MNLLTVYYDRNLEALALLQDNTTKGLGYFYIIEFSEKLIKIGCTRYPATRIEQLSCTIAKEIGLPIKRIAVSGQCKYFRKYEANLHKTFEKHRIPKSELFIVSFDTVLEFGISLIESVNQDKREKGKALMEIWINKLIPTIKIGNFKEALGISFMTGIETSLQVDELEI